MFQENIELKCTEFKSREDVFVDENIDCECWKNLCKIKI